MLEFVKQLFENNVISEEVKSEIEIPWENRSRKTQIMLLHNCVKNMHRSTNTIRSQWLKQLRRCWLTELQQSFPEFAEDPQGLIEAKAKYAGKIRKRLKAMEAFVS